jgi:sirohydrochlorin cobaltochelatase
LNARTSNAIVLFAHGARDARWSEPLERMREALMHARPQTRVETAFLELQEPGLAGVLEFLAVDGVRRIDIVPVFWSRGGHVAVDLPQLVGAFRDRHAGVEVRVLPVLSELDGMEAFIIGAILRQVER